MLYSSLWMRVPSATAPVMTDLIVVCCTLASMRSTTSPPRWIRPRTGGLSFASVPRPGAPPHRPPPPPCAAARAGPFDNSGGLTLVAGHHVDLIDLHLARQFHLR